MAMSGGVSIKLKFIDRHLSEEAMCWGERPKTKIRKVSNSRNTPKHFKLTKFIILISHLYGR